MKERTHLVVKKVLQPEINQQPFHKRLEYSIKIFSYAMNKKTKGEMTINLKYLSKSDTLSHS